MRQRERSRGCLREFYAKTPAVVCTFLGLGIPESRVVPRSRPPGVRSIFQQVSPEIVFDFFKGVSVKCVRSLRAGKGEDPPTRWSGVGRLVGSHIGRTAKALVRGSGKKVMLVGWRRGFISCPRCTKTQNLQQRNFRRPLRAERHTRDGYDGSDLRGTLERLGMRETCNGSPGRLLRHARSFLRRDGRRGGGDGGDWRKWRSSRSGWSGQWSEAFSLETGLGLIGLVSQMDADIPSLSSGSVGSRFVSQTELDVARQRREEQWKAAYAR